MTTVIVRSAFRGLGITKTMYETLIVEVTALHIPISTRTWSTNTAHIGLPEKLGFQMLHRIADDRGEGVDTIYFVIDA